MMLSFTTELATAILRSLGAFILASFSICLQYVSLERDL
jgi:hypothetical protein